MRSVFFRGAGMALLTLGAALTGFRASGQTVQLTTHTNFWYFNDTTASPGFDGTGWQLPNYDINSAPGWKPGIALFGNDGGGVYDGAGSPWANLAGSVNGFYTPLSRVPNARITYYFRTKFNWNTPTANVSLFANYAVDDGMVVFLNGTEIYRVFMAVAAPNPYTWDTLGQNHDPEGTRFDVQLPADQLVQGENTLAVEVHQSGTASSDIAFSLALRGIIPFRPIILTNSEPADRTVLQNRSTTLNAYADASPPISFQWFFRPTGGGPFSPVLDATNSSYLIASMQSTDGGDYFCTISNPVGSTNTRTARVTYSEDTLPPTVTRVGGSAAFDKVIVEFSEPVDSVGAVDTFNYHVDEDAIGVSSVVLNPLGASVTLTLSGPLGENEEHSIRVENIYDLTTVNLMATTNMTFRSWVTTECGGLLMETWNGTRGSTTAGTLGGNAITDLTGHPFYPNDPSEAFRINGSVSGLGFNTREAYADDSHEGYGGRLRGLFVPPFSGAWKFTLSSDDAGRLFFNPNGPQSTGAIQVANEGGCCGVLNLPEGDPRMSVPFNLTGGQAYYIEALWKEGTGGDFLQAAAILHGGGAVGGVTNAMPKEWIGTALPPGLLGDFNITQNPANVSTPDGIRVRFSVGTSTTIPLCYQWLRDGVDIPGAISPSYNITAQLGDNGAKFSVRVTMPGGSTKTSTEATLAVARDTIPPHVSGVSASSSTNVTVSFDDNQITAATAGNPINYQIDGVNPISATISNGTNVTLVPALPLAACVDHVLRVSGVKDTSDNTIVTTNVTFVTPIILVANSEGQTWKYAYPTDITGVPPADWMSPGFNDSGWTNALAPLGFETDLTTMPAGWPMRTSFTDFVASKLTLYLRTHFNLPTHKSTITRLELREVLDDGDVAYINGVRVHLNRVTEPYDYNFSAAGSTEPHPVEGPFLLPTDALVQGDNVLAVEVHQSGTGSSDIVFGAELVALVSRCGVGLTITPVSATQARLDWPDPTYRVQAAATIDGVYTTLNVNSGAIVDINSGNRYYRLIKQ